MTIYQNRHIWLLATTAFLVASKSACAEPTDKPFEVFVRSVVSPGAAIPKGQLRHTGVTLEGRASADISCEPRTQDDGRLRCKLKECDPKADWPKYYLIGFESVPNQKLTSPAEATVDKCAVKPTPVHAVFATEQHVHFQSVADLTEVENKIEDYYKRTGNYPSGKFMAETTLLAVAQEQDGAFRIAALRQVLQNASLASAQQGEKEQAVAFEAYARTTVNLSLKIMAEKVNKELAANITVDGSLAALQANLDKLQDARTKMVVPGAWDNALLNSVQPDLRKGNLGTPQLRRFDRVMGLDGDYGNLPTPNVQQMPRR